MPKVLENPHDIDGPVIEICRRKRQRGYFIARIIEDFGEMSTLKRNLLFRIFLGCALLTFLL